MTFLLIALLALVQVSPPLDEADFWQRLLTTEALLETAITQVGQSGGFDPAPINDLWVNVTAVRLQNGAIIQVDTGWLRVEAGMSATELRLVQQRIQAILEFRQGQGDFPLSESGSQRDELNDVVEDDRFDYGEESSAADDYQEEKVEEAPASTPTLPLIPAQLSQLILLVLGLIAVIGFVTYLLRGLNVQRATIAESGEDIPVTAEAAGEMAAQSQMTQDYRAAIRYLYLASLLTLDEKGTIHFDPHLTNYEHLSQLQRGSQQRELLTWIVNVFDQVWYGFAPANEGLYQQFQQQVERLKNL